ncbi:MAG: histone-like nucleoid-structuring protein Lsr2, partial [Streptosporangiaceae bacterium]
MARQTIVTVTDDIDGTEGAQTVTFGYDGQTWEIDLGTKNYGKFTSTFAPFVTAARRAPGSGPRRASRPVRDRRNSAVVRQWARETGIKLSERGRIP